jgi:hypothetical protein
MLPAMPVSPAMAFTGLPASFGSAASRAGWVRFSAFPLEQPSSAMMPSMLAKAHQTCADTALVPYSTDVTASFGDD